jgi:hypothetical protein
MGCSFRTFREEPLARPRCCRKWSPLTRHPKPVHEGSRDPALWESGRGSRFSRSVAADLSFRPCCVLPRTFPKS